VRLERSDVQDVALDEVDVLEVLVLVEEDVVDAHVVAGVVDPVGQPAADVAGASDDQDVLHVMGLVFVG